MPLLLTTVQVFGLVLSTIHVSVNDLASAPGAFVGPGRGPVYGTRAHSAFRAEVEALRRSNLRAEVSYKNGTPVRYGTKGSVRLDVVEGPIDAPIAVYDFKTVAHD